MSIIKCPECGHNVSSKAEQCPQCGVKIAGNLKRCPVCQSTMLMDASSCPHCHTRLEVETEMKHSEEDALSKDSTTTGTAVTSSTEASIATDVSDSQEATRFTAAEATTASTQKSIPWYLLLFIIVIVALGAYLYWDTYQQRRSSEEKAFELLHDCNDPLNFEDFIARYPNSDYLDEVRAMLRELQKEEAVWEVVAQSANVESLKNFIQTHPQSPFIKVALHKIDSLDWREADRKGSSAAYDTYILHHDAGEYITEAYSARDAAREREERSRRDSIAAAQAEADSLVLDRNPQTATE